MIRRKGTQIDLAQALRRIERRLESRAGGSYVQVKVAAAWEKVAGPAVLEHTTGAYLREGELLVHVDSNAWATELSSMAGPYLEAFRKEMGQTPVSGVRFTVSQRVDQRRRRVLDEEAREEFYRPDPSPSLPLSDVELAQVKESVLVIEDPELREAAIRATVADLEGKKGRAAAQRREAASEGL